MGMTIEEAIEHGKEQLEIFGGTHGEFIETTINTMRKYQKIEQIVKTWNDMNSFDSMVQINGVITGWTRIVDKYKAEKEE